MNFRLKQLRKFLNLNQTEFGNKLGVTTTAISKIEKGERNITKQMFISICREFKVNENWLRTGEGEMFNQENDTLIDKLAKEYNLDDFNKKLAKTYLNLTEKQKNAVKDFMKEICNEPSNTITEEAAAAEPQEYINMSLEELAKLQAKHAAKVAEIESIINFKNEDTDFPDENILA